MRKLCSRLFPPILALAALFAAPVRVSAQVLRNAAPYDSHPHFAVHKKSPRPFAPM